MAGGVGQRLSDRPKNKIFLKCEICQKTVGGFFEKRKTKNRENGTKAMNHQDSKITKAGKLKLGVL